MSENPSADYWYKECQYSDSTIAEVKGVLLRINVFDGKEQYETSIREIYQVVELALKAQAKRREEHATKLIAEAKARNKQ